MVQVLVNVLDNVVKYSPEYASIEVSASLEKDHAITLLPIVAKAFRLKTRRASSTNSTEFGTPKMSAGSGWKPHHY